MDEETVAGAAAPAPSRPGAFWPPAEPAQNEPPGPPADGDEFGAGSFGQRQRPAPVGEVKRGPLPVTTINTDCKY